MANFNASTLTNAPARPTIVTPTRRVPIQSELLLARVILAILETELGALQTNVTAKMDHPLRLELPNAAHTTPRYVLVVMVVTV